MKTRALVYVIDQRNLQYSNTDDFKVHTCIVRTFAINFFS